MESTIIVEIEDVNEDKNENERNSDNNNIISREK